jgi:hypothetical protein
VLARATVKALPLTNRAADFAAVAPACCNVCRTCTTTNLVGLASGAVLAAAAAISSLAKRVARG